MWIIWIYDKLSTFEIEVDLLWTICTVTIDLYELDLYKNTVLNSLISCDKD